MAYVIPESLTRRVLEADADTPIRDSILGWMEEQIRLEEARHQLGDVTPDELSLAVDLWSLREWSHRPEGWAAHAKGDQVDALRIMLRTRLSVPQIGVFLGTDPASIASLLVLREDWRQAWLAFDAWWIANPQGTLADKARVLSVPPSAVKRWAGFRPWQQEARRSVRPATVLRQLYEQGLSSNDAHAELCRMGIDMLLSSAHCLYARWRRQDGLISAKSCVVCGTSFIPKPISAVTCSPGCGKARRLERNREAKRRHRALTLDHEPKHTDGMGDAA